MKSLEAILKTDLLNILKRLINQNKGPWIFHGLFVCKNIVQNLSFDIVNNLLHSVLKI